MRADDQALYYYKIFLIMNTKWQNFNPSNVISMYHSFTNININFMNDGIKSYLKQKKNNYA